MASADFVKRLGIFVVRDFIDRPTCAALRAASRAAEATPATIYSGSEVRELDVDSRRTLRAHVSDDLVTNMRTRVLALMPEVARHFNVSLTGCQDPQFLVYREGDFFSKHADAGDDSDDPDTVRERKISVVVFLSDETVEAAADGAHRGGSLVFYNLIDDPRLAARGVPLTAEQGLLVAFRADTWHRVNVVTAGERHSIVAWFV